MPKMYSYLRAGRRAQYLSAFIVSIDLELAISGDSLTMVDRSPQRLHITLALIFFSSNCSLNPYESQ